MQHWIDSLLHPDAQVRREAAKALERGTREDASSLAEHAGILIHHLATSETPMVRWQLAVIVPRLPLTPSERDEVFEILLRCLDDQSSL